MTVPAHWLPANEGSRIPRCWVVVDTEAHRAETASGEVQTFRCAVASHDCFKLHSKAGEKHEIASFEDAASLWRWVSERSRSGKRTVVVAHNLAYDLRVGKAFRHLPELGWELKMVKLDPGQAWAVWRRAKSSLIMVDSVSWLPKALEQIAPLVDSPKLELPREEDDPEAWLARCEADVQILRKAWLRLMHWLEEDDLGVWKPTGAGMALTAFRHKFLTHKLLCHQDKEAKDAERLAGWTGRCEAYRWGDLPNGPYWEWDMSTAYARVAQNTDVPTRLVSKVKRGSLEEWKRWRRHFAIISQVTITTALPTVPARGPVGIYWPVGTFETTLWDHELELALQNGATVKIGPSLLYRKGPALKEWADWILAALDPDNKAIDPVIQLAIKHWSRALIGRFGSRFSEWDDFGEALSDDVILTLAGDASDNTKFRLLQLGKRVLKEGELVEDQNGLPQIMGHIMASCRINLWHIMEKAGFENVVYCDTDGILVNSAGNEALLEAAIPGLRVKRKWRNVTILGPRQLVLDGQLKASGVPARAVQVSEKVWQGQVWQRLPASLRQGQADRVEVKTRAYTLYGTDNRRTHLPNGATAPIPHEAAMTTTGGN